MSTKNSLLISRGIFTIFVIVAFGLIIMNEKSTDLFKNKADKLINEYIETNYSQTMPSFILEETKGKNKAYQKKIISKQNNHHYFYVKYSNKTISDTYKEDYEEGKSLLTHITKQLEKDILDQTNTTCTIQPTTTLDQYSEGVKEKIIKEDHLLELRFYYLQKELLINNWNKTEITKQIKDIIQKMKEHHISPKYYEITITNQNEITTSIKISNITEDFLENSNVESIIEDILNNKEIKDSKITYQYQN